MDERSSELSPVGVEHVPGKDELRLAGTADEMLVGAVREGPRVEGVAPGRLKKAYFAFMHAMWAKPVRWIAVCVILLERIDRKAGHGRNHLITARLCVKLLQLMTFCFKRKVFFKEKLVLLLKGEVRALRVANDALKGGNGGLDLDVLRDCEDVAKRSEYRLERGGRGHCACDKIGWCHFMMPFVFAWMSADIIAHL